MFLNKDTLFSYAELRLYVHSSQLHNVTIHMFVRVCDCTASHVCRNALFVIQLKFFQFAAVKTWAVSSIMLLTYAVIPGMSKIFLGDILVTRWEF